MSDTGDRRARDAPAQILVVDDVPTNIRLLVRVLAPEYSIVAATSGEQALRLARERAPDLILLDVEMPDMDGYKVCRLLKENPQTAAIPVIFVTARNDEADEVEGLGLGAVDYITKPFREAIVCARVRTHLELKRYRDLLQNRSYIDGLTGVANRRRFDEVLPRTLLKAQQTGRAMGLLLLDVDHFKAYNDGLGHLAGDECLRQVASALAACVRHDSDLLARYGGEEFAFVLPDTDRDELQQLAERVRACVEALALPHPSNNVDGLSISVGAASSEDAQGSSADALIASADQALYRAKQQGRNRVCVA